MAHPSPVALDPATPTSTEDPLDLIARAVAGHEKPAELFRVIGPALARLGESEVVLLCRKDAAGTAIVPEVLASPWDRCAVTDLALALAESPAGWVLEHGAPLAIPDLAAETRFARARALLLEHGLRACFHVPLATPRRTLGALGFARPTPGEPDRRVLARVLDAAKLVALGLESALDRAALDERERQLASERERLQLFRDVSRAIASHLDLQRLIEATGDCLQRLVPSDSASLSLLEPDGKSCRVHALQLPESKGLVREGAVFPLHDTPAARAIALRQPILIHTPEELGAWVCTEVAARLTGEGLASGCSLPLVVHDRVLGTLNVASRRAHAFDAAALELLVQVAAQLAPAVANALSYHELQELKNRLSAEKTYLETELRADRNLDEIVGTSERLTSLLEQVKTVAPTDATVLVSGETGTGKELIARAVHALGRRRDRTFVKINCAAIPTGLLESELFGHEKGAFTGAIAQKVGRFELAHRGTLLLDEIGEIPLELQPKLLRVLQEQTFERLGGTKTTRVDVRVIAATNRDLERMVAEGRFRSDLYYRLNVFPVRLPALRERPEDVPLLVRHFVKKFARRAGKSIDAIPPAALEALVRYPWPGNIRELENLVERSVILTRGSVLEVPLAELRAPEHGTHAASSASPPTSGSLASSPLPASPTAPSALTLAEGERQLILKTLRETSWVVGGPTGAAARLGMNRTTLHSRMRKHGISRPT